MVFEGFRPGVEPGGAAGRHRADAADRLGPHGALNALGLMLDEVQDERPADALAMQVTAISSGDAHGPRRLRIGFSPTIGWVSERGV